MYSFPDLESVYSFSLFFHLGLANLNNSGGLWAIRVVSNQLVPGSGMIQDRGNTALVRENYMRSWLGQYKLGIYWFSY